MLVVCMLDSVSNPFMTASAATGKVRIYQSVVGGILIAIVPMAYLVLKLGGNPYSVFLVHIFIGLIAFVARLLIVRKLINLSIRKYIKNVIIPCTLVFLPSVFFALLIKNFMINEEFTFINIIIIVIMTILLCFFLGLSKSERVFVLDKVKNRRI